MRSGIVTRLPHIGRDDHMRPVRRFLHRTAIALALIPALALSTGVLPAAAQSGQVLVGASSIEGIGFDTWATGDVDPIEVGQRLRLSRLHFDPCTGIVLHNTGGSVLLY